MYFGPTHKKQTVAFKKLSPKDSGMTTLEILSLKCPIKAAFHNVFVNTARNNFRKKDLVYN